MTALAPLLSGLALLASCGHGGTGPELRRTAFSVEARAGHLWLANNSSAPVHYVALEAETATRVDLIFDPEQWPSLPAGGEEMIPYDELTGYEPGAQQAVVYWWTAGEYGDPIRVTL